MRIEMQGTGGGGGTDLADLAYQSEFLKHSAGRELFIRMRDFISETWAIDTGTSILCAKEAVLCIEAKVRRASPVRQGGLGMCRMSKIAKFIDANLAQRIGVSELAAQVGLSRSQLQRAFKQSFGEPTRMYLINRRIERAKTLMLSSKANSADIALTCGFSDQSHMTRLFTRLVGESPNCWRRNRVGA